MGPTSAAAGKQADRLVRECPRDAFSHLPIGHLVLRERSSLTWLAVRSNSSDVLIRSKTAASARSSRSLMSLTLR